MTTDTLLAGAERFDIKEFQAYLEANPDTHFKTSSTCGCPIAIWLWHKWNNPPCRVHVDGVTARITQGTVDYTYKLPNWAKDFIVIFDTYQEENDIYHVPSQWRLGTEALDMLKNVKV